MFEQNIQVIENAIRSISLPTVQINDRKEIANISKQIAELKKAPTTILVCGEFKRGKSTFINTLIGRKICPTNTDICTAVVSIIRYGAKEKAVRTFGNLTDVKSEEIPFSNLEQYIDDIEKKYDDTICIELELPLDELKKGLVVIDTPGVGGLDPRHAMLTNHFLPQSDVVLFMTDVIEPLTTTELDFFKDKVLQYAEYSAVIVNKSDVKDKETVEKIRLDTINKISEYAQTEAPNLNVISCSAKNLDNFDNVRALINMLVDKRKNNLLSVPKRMLAEQLALSIKPLRTKLSQIEEPDSNQIEKLSKEKEEIEKKIADIKGSDFNYKISQKIRNENETITLWLNSVCADLSKELDNMIKDERAKEDNGGEWVGQQLNYHVQNISSETQLKLNKAFERIAEMKEFDYISNTFSSSVDSRNVEAQTSLYRDYIAVSSGLGAGGLVVGAISIFTGGVPLLVWGLGSIVAWLVGRSASKEAKYREIESKLRQEYQPQLGRVTNDLRTYINNRFSDFQGGFINFISHKADEYQDVLQKSITELRNLKTQQTVANNLRTTLQQQLKPLVEAKDSIDKLSL